MSTRASGRAKRDPRQDDQRGPHRFSSRCRRTPTPATETKIPTGISTVSAVRLPLRGHLGSRLAVGCGPGVAVSVTVTVGPGTVLVTVTAGRPVLGQATSPRAFGSAVRWHWTCMGAFFLAQRESRHKWWDPCAAAGSLRRRNPPCVPAEPLVRAEGVGPTQRPRTPSFGGTCVLTRRARRGHRVDGWGTVTPSEGRISGNSRGLTRRPSRSP